MDRPTPFEWCTTPTGIARAVFPTAIAPDGYAFEDVPTHEDLDGVFRRIALNLSFLSGGVVGFDTVEEGIANTTPGQVFASRAVVAGTVRPGDVVTTLSAVGVSWQGQTFDTDGRYLYGVTASGTTWQRHTPSTGAAVGSAVALPSGRGLLSAIAVAGAFLVAASRDTGTGETWLTVYDLTDDSVAWSKLVETHANRNVVDVQVNHDRLFLVTAEGSLTADSKVFGALIDQAGPTGTIAWTYTHAGGALSRVACDADRVYVGGKPTSSGSGACLRALVASNGADAANEGGTLADTTGTAWDATDGGAGLGIPGSGRLAVDGDVLITPEGATAGAPTSYDLVVRDRNTGAVLGATWTNPDGTATGNAVRNVFALAGHVYVCTADALFVLSLARWPLQSRRVAPSPFGASSPWRSDGVRLFAGWTTATTRPALIGSALVGPVLIQRVDPTTFRDPVLRSLIVRADGRR